MHIYGSRMVKYKTKPYVNKAIQAMLIFIMVRLFTEYDVARKSQVLHWNFSILRATSYSISSQVTVPKYSSTYTEFN